jgi:hypothetical protein
MNKPHTDDFIKYLTSRENLPYTLDILSQGNEIRRRVFCEFWRGVQQMLRDSTPRALRSEKLSWALWPDEKRMDSESAGVYLWPSQSGKQNQGINFSVVRDSNQSLFFGLSWEKAPKPSLLKLPSVRRLIDFLSEKEFKPTTWWLGWKYINRNQDEDGLLLGYARDRGAIHGQIQESFWPFAEESFDMVVKANKAVRDSI